MNALRAQFNLLFKRKTFTVTLAVLMLFSFGLFIFNCIDNFNSSILDVKSANNMFIYADYNDVLEFIIGAAFPLIAAIAFSDTFFEEHKMKTSEFCFMRISNRQYYFSKMAVVFFSGFALLALPFLTNLLLNFIAFPLDSYAVHSGFSYIGGSIYNSTVKTIIFKDLFVESPTLYNMLFIFFLSLAGGLSAVIVYQFSFFYNKSRILLLCSFFAVYNFLEILVQFIEKLESYDLQIYIFPDQYFSSQTPIGIIVVFSLLLAAAFLPTPFALKKLGDFYE